jgi:hypothetical protein
MRSYSDGVFTPEEQVLLREATRIIEMLPDPEEVLRGVRYARPRDLRCHELARAVGEVLGLAVQDGHYGAVEHSWLWTTKDPPYTAILDVYCVGSLPQVRLLDGWALLPHLRTKEDGLPAIRTAYVPGELRTDIDEAKIRELVDLIRRRAGSEHEFAPVA